jgi:hypothetical protein
MRASLPREASARRVQAAWGAPPHVYLSQRDVSETRRARCAKALALRAARSASPRDWFGERVWRAAAGARRSEYAGRQPHCGLGRAAAAYGLQFDPDELFQRTLRRGRFMQPVKRGRGRAMPRRRRGSLTIEMILVVVVLAIVTVGIVQFGVFFANADEVALAARVAALEASQTPNLPASGSVPANVLAAVEHQLQSSLIDWVRIRLEHNVTPGDAPAALAATTPGYVVAAKTNLAAPPTAGTHYVRLTVCVPLADVYPKQLSVFGEQLFAANRTYEHTVLMRYELSNP